MKKDFLHHQKKDFARSEREQITYVLILIFFIVISIFVQERDAQDRVSGAIQIKDGWITENGDVVSLDDIPLGSGGLSKTVAQLPLEGKALCFQSIDTTFSVYADEKLIYDYHPVFPRRFGLSYGMYVHTIAIPEGTSKIRILAESTFPAVKASLTHAAIDESGQYMLRYFRNNLFSFGLSTLTLLLGLFFLIIGLSSTVMMRSAGIDFISFGITCILIGFIGYNDTLMLQVLTGRPALIRVITYVCLIFMPFPALAFFASAVGNSRSKLVSCMLILCLVDFCVQGLLTYCGYTDYYYLVNISHAVIAVSFVMAIWFVIRAIREGSIRPVLLNSIVGGLIACLVGAGIDLTRYYFFQSNGSSACTRIGVFLFMVLISFFLFQDQTRALKQKHRDSMILVGEITEAFAKVIDMKDSYTNGHSARVARYTAMLARELQYDDETVEKYYRIALLHDVGKIGIPKEVLNKPGKLTDDEYAVIKSHTTKGYSVLKDISIMPELAIGAQAHHERIDGRGYPDGLTGEQIPRVAQIIAVADCFDAMYSNRPYRKRMKFEKAVSIIREVAGTQLAPDVVDAFLRLVNKGEFRDPTDDGGGSTEDINNINRM